MTRSLIEVLATEGWPTLPFERSVRKKSGRSTNLACAVGRFRPDGPTGYTATTAPDAPVRPTRAEAEADEEAWLDSVRKGRA